MLHDLSSGQKVDLSPWPALASLGQPRPGVVALWVLRVLGVLGAGSKQQAGSRQKSNKHARKSTGHAAGRQAKWSVATWSLLLIKSSQRLRCRPGCSPRKNQMNGSHCSRSSHISSSSSNFEKTLRQAAQIGRSSFRGTTRIPGCLWRVAGITV